MNSFIKSVTKSLKKSIRISVKLNCFVFESKTLLLQNIITDLKFRPEASGLLKIGKFCESFHEIHLQSQDQSIIQFPIIESLRVINFSSIFNLSQLIRRVIDIEGCKTSEIYTIRQHVSPELDILRNKYSNLPNFLVHCERHLKFFALIDSLDFDRFGNRARN